MAPCCIKGCDNRGEKRSKKNSGITYHLFPRDAVRRRSWLQALGRGTDWQPSNATVVCSQHFLPSHFYVTPYGLKRLKDEAIPVLNINMVAKHDKEALAMGEGRSGEALVAMLAGGAVPGVTLDASDSPATHALATQLLHLTIIYEKQKKKLRNLRQSLRRHDAKLQSMSNPLSVEVKNTKRLKKDNCDKKNMDMCENTDQKKINIRKCLKENTSCFKVKKGVKEMHQNMVLVGKVKKKNRKGLKNDTFKIVFEDRNEIVEIHENVEDPLNI